MQERRATIRVSCQSRIHYCPSEDLLPRDGRLTNLSERGAGLLTREAHHTGERVTISVPLSQEEEGVTATGLVRWSSPVDLPRRLIWGRWHSVGLEWLPLEETTREHLHRFLEETMRLPRAHPSATRIRGRALRRVALLTVVVLGFVAAGLLGLWLLLLGQENRRLHETVQQRTALVRQLEQRERGLQQELGTARQELGSVQQELEGAKTQVANTIAEVVRMDQQTQHLEADVERLGQDVAHIQESYVKVREEREQLMQRVLGLQEERLRLEQERRQLTHRLSSIPDLRLAIQEAIRARKAEARAQRRLLAQARGQTERQAGQEGNRGYLIRESRPALNRSTVWIRVHEPEASPPPQADANQ